jgi:hypothetical protein
MSWIYQTERKWTRSGSIGTWHVLRQPAWGTWAGLQVRRKPGVSQLRNCSVSLYLPPDLLSLLLCVRITKYPTRDELFLRSSIQQTEPEIMATLFQSYRSQIPIQVDEEITLKEWNELCAYLIRNNILPSTPRHSLINESGNRSYCYRIVPCIINIILSWIACIMLYAKPHRSMLPCHACTCHPFT